MFLPLAFQTMFPLDVELGILAGLAVAISGYIQAYTKVDEKGNHEKFSVDKFCTTVIIGGVVGGVIPYMQLFDDAVTIFLSSAGIVAIVGSLIKAFLRIK